MGLLAQRVWLVPILFFFRPLRQLVTLKLTKPNGPPERVRAFTVNIHTHLWGAVFSVTLAALHILHQLEALPSFANAVAHHSLFYPESLKAETRLGQTISFAAPTSPSHAASMWARPPDWKDRAGFATFLTGAVLCLGFSATYHTVGCHSRDVSAPLHALSPVGALAPRGS